MPVIKEIQVVGLPVPFIGERAPVGAAGKAPTKATLTRLLELGLDWLTTEGVPVPEPAIDFKVGGDSFESYEVAYRPAGQNEWRMAVGQDINNTRKHPLLRRAGFFYDNRHQFKQR